MTNSVFREISLDKWQWSPSPLPGQIVLVTSQDESGVVDVAPKSWVTIVGMSGPKIGFGCTLEHQTARNVQATGEFAINIPDESLAAAAWQIADVQDRFAGTGLSTIPATTIGVPLIAECFAHLECVLDQVVRLEKQEVFIIGTVRRIDIDEHCLAPNDIAQRYAVHRPIFFLENQWLAALAEAKSVSRL